MTLFSTIFTGSFTIKQFLIAILVALVLGFLVSLYYMFNDEHSSSMSYALVLIPAIETIVIMMINDNLGAGIAVAGSFSLIRFRSIKGNAKELTCIFLSMAIGIMCGTGYVALAALFVIIVLIIGVIMKAVNFGDDKGHCMLKITVPESLNYEGIFDEVLNKYSKGYKLVSVKTVNLGSLFRIEYDINMKDTKSIKPMIDELRERNGNLEILCALDKYGEELWLKKS